MAERDRTLELGPFPACGFRLFLQPRRPLADRELLTAMKLDHAVALAPPSRCTGFVVSICEVGTWTHVADDYGLWNHRDRRRAAIDGLAALGDLFTFLLPDPDMSYAFALYRGGVRVRLRVVDSPGYSDQILRLDKGRPLPGEPMDWRGEPFPMMVSIARGLGIEVTETTPERFYSWTLTS